MKLSMSMRIRPICKVYIHTYRCWRHAKVLAALLDLHTNGTNRHPSRLPFFTTHLPLCWSVHFTLKRPDSVHDETDPRQRLCIAACTVLESTVLSYVIADLQSDPGRALRVVLQTIAVSWDGRSLSGCLATTSNSQKHWAVSCLETLATC
jgi:hypothetical protein